MAITVFPSANAVGGAGQKVLSERNLALWVMPGSRNYVREGLAVSHGPGRAYTVAAGAAIVDGRLVIADAATVEPPAGAGTGYIVLALSCDAICNTIDVALACATTLPADPHIVLAQVSWGSSEVLPDHTYDMRIYTPWPSLLPEPLFRYHTFFDSVDGFATTGTTTIKTDGYVECKTAATTNATASISRAVKYPHTRLSFDKPLLFRTNGLFPYGGVEWWAMLGLPGTAQHIGWRCVLIDTTVTLIATVADGASESTASWTTIPNGPYSVQLYPGERAVFKAGTTPAGVKEITTSLPTGTAARDLAIVNAGIKTCGAQSVYIQLSEWLVQNVEYMP